MSAAAVIDSTMDQPPAWAKLQRELLEKQTEACVEFFGASAQSHAWRMRMYLAAVHCIWLVSFDCKRTRRTTGGTSATHSCVRHSHLWCCFHQECAADLRTEHYFDVETGYGKWIPRWGGNDGPDDAAENGLNWTVLYAL
eukprot:COSAG02_NODE_23868_length_705_cov_1.884488_1_plen_139_part_10